MSRNNQVVRQWQIIRAIEQRGRTLRKLAEMFSGTTERTLRRDLDALQAAGFPLYDDESGRWRALDWRKGAA